jgi:poly-beta-1,6-N-acetyl-D-glucosamine synthase
MSVSRFSYAVVTPARNESLNLSRLGEAMLAQTVKPTVWVIVDHGSTDDTGIVSAELAARADWISTLSIDGEPSPTRGGPIVVAFNAGLRLVDTSPDVVVKLDADVSFDPDHFESLLGEFARDASLGIASSTCWENEGGSWHARRVGRSHVRGAVRAYRSRCLEQIAPLEPRMGWDTIDEIKAQINGWSTRSISTIAFYHHRATGARDGERRSWESQGHLAWYLDYRPSYLVFRTLFRALQDRHAVAMLFAWASSGVRREPRYPDRNVRRFLREQQSVRQLPRRAREVLRMRF